MSPSNECQFRLLGGRVRDQKKTRVDTGPHQPGRVAVRRSLTWLCWVPGSAKEIIFEYGKKRLQSTADRNNSDMYLGMTLRVSKGVRTKTGVVLSVHKKHVT